MAGNDEKRVSWVGYARRVGWPSPPCGMAGCFLWKRPDISPAPGPDSAPVWQSSQMRFTQDNGQASHPPAQDWFSHASLLPELDGGSRIDGEVFPPIAIEKQTRQYLQEADGRTHGPRKPLGDRQRGSSYHKRLRYPPVTPATVPPWQVGLCAPHERSGDD